jgi:hypothetical protein
MKKFHVLLLACLINTPLAATAKTVEVTGDSTQPDAWAVQGSNDYRTRFELGDGWADGVAHLRVVGTYRNIYEPTGTSLDMIISLATSENSEYMTPVPYYNETCRPYAGCYTYPIDGSEHFETFTVTDRVTGSPLSSWNSPVLTLDFFPILESGKSYYLFVQFWSSASFGDDISYVGSLSQVPVPAAAWLFGSGLLGLAAAGQRRGRI